ncbi:uncharacterized protein [Chelonus insularis]|uniref:uncharacterized protein n=1 Tax=Chelonus insularis TaxID=460826 RepID=UPI00158B5945|nr:uncharacterized protein LOC118073754 [Chelonus insularis]XP_034950351.1 uncharacterized protein LOC118073754 [Chelonus insularis]
MGSKLSDQMNSESNNDTNKKSYCHVCNIVVNCEIHNKEVEHLLKMDYFLKWFIKESENSVKCTICSEDVLKSDINKHAIQHELIPWYRPKDEFEKYFINFIALNNDTYRCYLCHKEVKYWFQAVSHCADPEHLQHMTKIDEKIVSTSFSFDFYKTCVLHSIFPFSVNKFKCFTCDYLIVEDKNIEEHISTKNHNELRFSSKQPDNDLLLQITKNCVLQSSQTEFYLQYFKNFIGILNEDEHWCYLCGEAFRNSDAAIDHFENPKHQSALITSIDDENIDTSLSLDVYEKCIRNSIFPKSIKELECIICDCYISGYKTIDEHISGKYHRKMKENDVSLQSTSEDPFQLFFKNFIGIIDKTFRCYVCTEFFTNEYEATIHIQQSNHKSLLNNPDFTNSQISLPPEYKFFIENSIFLSSSKLKCFICYDSFRGYLMAKNHIESKRHKKIHILCKSDNQLTLSKIYNNKSYNKHTSTYDYIRCFTNFIGFMKNHYWCFLCNQNFDNYEAAIIHTHNSNHRSKIRRNQTVNKNLSRQFYEHCIQHSIFPLSVKKVTCLICKKTFEYLKVIEHSNTQCHIHYISAFEFQCDNLLSTINITTQQKVRESILKYDQCFINFIGIIHNVYWCFICHEKFDYWDLAIAHIQSSKHRSNIGLINIKKINMNLTTKFYRLCVQEGIFPMSFNDIKCFICDREISSYLNAKGHANGNKHKNKYLGWKFTLNDISSIENCHNKIQSEENSVNSSQNSNDNHNDSIDENDVPETWKTIIDSDYSGKIITTLNSAQNPNVDKKTNKTDDGWISVNSMRNRAKIKNLSSKTTNSKLKSSKNLQQKKLSNINSKKTKRTKKIKQKSSNNKKNFFCIICEQKFKSDVPLHIHMSRHFRPCFIHQSNVQETALNLSSQNCQLNNIQTPIESVDSKSLASKHTLHIQINTPSILNSNFKTFNQKKEYDEKKTNKVLKRQRFRSRKFANCHGSDQLIAQKRSKKNLLKAADIFEPDKTRRIDLYKIDSIQLEMINLSVTRCYLLDKEYIYCLICRKKISYSVITVFEHFRSINHNDYLLIMIQDHIKFMSFPDQLSDLSLAREWMEDISDKFVECYGCQKKIKNDVSTLKEHLSEKNHIYQRAQIASKMAKLFECLYSKMERNWYKVRSYWCVPCRKNYRLENEFYKHIDGNGNKKSKHLQQCQKFSKFTNFILDYCPTCTTLFYGFRDTFAYHCEIEKHKYFRERPFYAVNQLPSVVEEILFDPDSVMNKMIESLDAKAEERQEDEKLIIEDLELIVNNPMTAKAYAFGSRISGLSSKTSDLDIFLDCDNRYYRGKKTDNINPLLKQVEKRLKICTEIWTINRTITDCTVPIIKVTHKPLSIECDISFLNGLTTECTQLIRTINQKLPLCRKLILFVKQWMNMCNLSGENGISNYAVAWMVIYYLQTRSIMKSIITLIKDRDESKMIGGWETGASLDFSIPESTENFRDLLKGFFEMITTFNFRNNIICPLLGEPLAKKCFSDAKKLLPGEMETYKQNCKLKNHEIFRIDSPLCVQDPYDLSHNITKATKKIAVSKLITLSTLTIKKLNNGDIHLI